MSKSKHEFSNKISSQRTKATESETILGQEQGPSRFELSLFDYIAAPIVAALASVWAFRYIGTSINWDELIYMNLSQYTTPLPYIMNRYGHVYLQKIFFWLANDSINGTRAYWCFQIFFTAVLVYWCAKMLAGRRGHVIGVIAVLMYCMQAIFLRWLGSTFPDNTIMYLIMLGIYVYLAFVVERYEHRNLFIMLLGLIFFWAVKSKELGICMGVLFFGLGVNKAGIFTIKRFVQDIGWVCAGMATGCVLLMLLDQIFMGDAIFSVRPSNIKELLASNFEEFIHSRPSQTWYTFESKETLFGPGLLYLLMGWKISREKLGREKIAIWLIPLGLLAFMMLTNILQGRYYVVGRYFTPAIPIICIWSAQLFKFDISGFVLVGKSKLPIPKIVITLVLVLAAVAAFYLIMPKEGTIVKLKLKTIEEFYLYAIMPFAATVLVVVWVLSRKRELMALFVSYLCLLFLIIPPLKSNLKSLKLMQVARKSQYRYIPYRVFGSELTFGKNKKMLISKDIHKRSWMLAWDEPRFQCYMFNIFFNQKYDFDQFIDGSRENILKSEYDYALLTWREWKEISEQHNVEHLLRNYILKADKTTQLILLKRR